VIISSHFLSEISQTCDRLLVIHGGELVGQGSEAELGAAMAQGSRTIEAEVRGGTADVAARLAALADVTQAQEHGTPETSTVYTIVANTDVRAEVARLLVAAGCDLLRLEARAQLSLESIFMSLTAKPTGGPQ
jgi:ABC-2 type transport system ATP-binding protein